MSDLSRQLLGEARPSKAGEVLAALTRQQAGLKVVDTWSQADGYATLIRTEDGQAYELQIRPAAYAKHPGLAKATGAGRGTARP